MLLVVSINVEGSIIVNILWMLCNFQQFFGDNLLFCQDGFFFQSLLFCQGGGQGGQFDGGQQQKFMVLGFGVIIDVVKGYVVINNYVVDNVIMIKVQLSDGCRFDVKVVGKDLCFDIVLIQIQDLKNLMVIKFVDFDVLCVGDYIVVIGNLFGLGEIVIFGIVFVLGCSGFNVENYENFIQIDVVINCGNFGGVLVNFNGELIGINIVILVLDGGNIGIGFVILSNMVKNLIEQMVKYGQVKCGEFGIMGIELNFELVKVMKVDVQCGVFVSQVMSGLVVVKVGIKVGDVIIFFNGKVISSFVVLCVQVGIMFIGSKVEFGLLCDGKLVIVIVELQQSNQIQVDFSIIFNGIEGVEMSNKGQDKGVVVNNVKVGILVVQIGFKKGDVIVGVNQQLVKNIVDLWKIFDVKLFVLVLNIQCGDVFIYLLLQ